MMKSIWNKRVLTVLFACLLVSAMILSDNHTSKASTTTLNPEEDTQVYAGSPTSTSNGSKLTVKNDPNYGNESFLKFDTSGVGAVTSATLRIYGSTSPYDSSDPFDVAAFGVDDDSWEEGVMTWNTRPSASTSAMDSVYVTSTEQYYELDVTSYVTSETDGSVSLLLQGVQQYERAYFNSKENASNPPELVLETSTTPPPSGGDTLNPEEDTQVYAGSPTSTSNGSRLTVKNDPGYGNESFLKFDTSGVGTVTSATLRIYGSTSPYDSSDPFDVAAFGVDDDSWEEGVMTWNTRPSASTSALDSVYVTSTEQYYELDVTSYVTSETDGIVSILLQGVQPYERAYFNSSENISNPPELVLSASTSPPNPPTSSVGFSELEPSADSKLIYVSNSGNDGNVGSESSPVKTITHAATLVRDGYPDWILLKRGDTWKDQGVGSFINGRSASEPAVVTYYGESGPRPLIKASSDFVDINGHIRDYQAFVGLNIVSYKMDPNDSEFDGVTKSAMRFVGSSDYLLIEDNKLQYTSITVQGYNGIYKNVHINRNIVVDNYKRGTTTTTNKIRTSGMFVKFTDGLNITENVFDHNGWNADFSDSLANRYSHNIYIEQENVGNNVHVKGNILSRGASHGIHGRPGGLYEDNLFVRNSIGLQMGYVEKTLSAGTFAKAKNNVILEGKRMICCPETNSYPQTQAIWGLYLEALGDGTVTVENNVAANRRESGNSNVGIKDLPGVTYLDNIQYEWGGGIGDMSDASWLDPERSVGSYNATLGGTAVLESFLEVVRNREVGEWDEDYSAYSVNDYIRAGFNK